MHAAPYAVLAMVPLLGLLAMFARERQGRLGNLLELNDTYRGTALLLGDVISADDEYTGEHSQGVVGLALAVGDALGLDAEQRRNLEFGALLHDVGKIAIPKEIINKPGKLDPDEWEIIKTHPAEGRADAQPRRRLHGRGRSDRAPPPRALGWRAATPTAWSAETIPLEARIITACDSWNAMRTDRPYRAARFPMTRRSPQIVENSGSQFDPAVAAALLRVVAGSEGAVAPGANHESVVVAVEAQDVGGADVARDPEGAPQGAWV